MTKTSVAAIVAASIAVIFLAIFMVSTIITDRIQTNRLNDMDVCKDLHSAPALRNNPPCVGY